MPAAMAPGTYRFASFTLDPANRQLRGADGVVELNSRYLDALLLLVVEHGRLVSKQRFMDEVWRGVPVTDEALTQCIRTLRRQLGDSATEPRFIETVPKHGYRFVAAIEVGGQSASIAQPIARAGAPGMLLVGGAGTAGAGLAGLIGGLAYGFAGALQPDRAQVGATSVLLVLLCVTLLAALTGGAGVAFGIAWAERALRPSWWRAPLGGGLGGFLIGGAVKLLGLDAFDLLLGHSPGNVTGASEGAALGAAVGMGVWFAGRTLVLRRGVACAALIGAGMGVLIPLGGGRLMGGSLDLLARRFPDSRLRLDGLGRLFGEQGFGLAAQCATGAAEGALFAGCIAAAIGMARRRG